LPDFISTGWWECTQIGERLNKKVIEVAGGGSILEDIFLPILEKCLFSSSQWF